MTTATTITRKITYCRETKDFALYLDGELIGYARTYLEGEETLNAVAYERARLLGETVELKQAA